MKFTLPLPPSINRTYGVWNSKMYKNSVGKDWEDEAGYAILIQRHGEKKPMLGRLQVGIDWYIKRDRDIDAGLKILLDVLQTQQVYENDKQIKRITHIDSYEDKINPRVEITIDEMV